MNFVCLKCNLSNQSLPPINEVLGDVLGNKVPLPPLFKIPLPSLVKIPLPPLVKNPLPPLVKTPKQENLIFHSYDGPGKIFYKNSSKKCGKFNFHTVDPRDFYKKDLYKKKKKI
jgi:hypothetical protein